VEIRKARHVAYVLQAHLVSVTKRRGKVFAAAHLKRLEQIFRSVRADFETLGIVPEKHTRALPGNTATLARGTTQIQGAGHPAGQAQAE
jgi:hypothetical protein